MARLALEINLLQKVWVLSTAVAQENMILKGKKVVLMPHLTALKRWFCAVRDAKLESKSTSKFLCAGKMEDDDEPQSSIRMASQNHSRA